MMHPQSITFRLTLFFSTASTIVLLLIGLLVDSLVESHFEHMDQTELEGKLQLIRHALANVHSDKDIAELPGKLNDALVGHAGLFAAILDAEKHLVFSTTDKALTDHLMSRLTSKISFQHSKMVILNHNVQMYRGLSAYASTNMPRQPKMLIGLATNIEHHQEFMAAFHRNLWLAICACIVLTILLGWFAARRGLAPVREMAEVTRGVSASHLGERIPLESVPLELNGLALDFNDMLARLESSFKRLSEFSSNLAHELRTPISNLMTQTQVMLSRERSADEYREILYSSLEEYKRLARMISDMLLLAKADNGQLVPDTELIDLAHEVSELFAFYEAVADEKNVVLTLFGKASIKGNKLMLRRALSNLLSNAIRHSFKNSEVTIRIETQPNMVTLTVQNSGERIPSEHIPLLFNRFYRVDPSRQKTSDGAGLGLAITKSIIEAHQGKVRVVSDQHSTRFEITLSKI